MQAAGEQSKGVALEGPVSIEVEGKLRAQARAGELAWGGTPIFGGLVGTGVCGGPAGAGGAHDRDSDSDARPASAGGDAAALPAHSGDAMVRGTAEGSGLRGDGSGGSAGAEPVRGDADLLR
jgi:hypothetical protein